MQMVEVLGRGAPDEALITKCAFTDSDCVDLRRRATRLPKG
jgi:hypothetical protein